MTLMNNEKEGEAVESAIEVRDLNFFYKRNKQALFDVNIAFPRDKVTALIGPSGSGKSTLLRTLNRIFDLHKRQKCSGSIAFEGQDVLKLDDISAHRRKVGMVFQKPTPFPMSIYKNIAFAIKHHERLSRRELDARVEQALSQAALFDEVKDQLKSLASALSGGQQQRLCLARTLAMNPEVLLLDEPTASLDPASTLKIERLVEELRGQYTVIIVTHNLRQAERISDYTGFLKEGRLVEFGATEEVFKSPKNKLTEAYIQHA